MSLDAALKRVDALKAELDALGPMSAEREQTLWKKLRLEWNYNSNHIEGNTLTYAETELLLIFDKTTGDHLMREYEEMQAHDVAIHQVREWALDPSRPLSEADIRSLNKTILVKPFWKDAQTLDGQATRRQIHVGEYKKHPNSVRLANGEMFHYASPDETPRLMGELIEWFRQAQDLHAAVLAAELHYRFIRIHPFDDGNGRVARLLANYVLMRAGLPPVVIKTAEKEKYLTALQKEDAGFKDAFAEYMAGQVEVVLGWALKAAKGESADEPGDVEKEVELFKRRILATSKTSVFYSEKGVGHLLNEVLPQITEDVRSASRQFKDLFSTISVFVEAQYGAGIIKTNRPEDIASQLSGDIKLVTGSSVHIVMSLEQFLWGDGVVFSVVERIHVSLNQAKVVFTVGSTLKKEINYDQDLPEADRLKLIEELLKVIMIEIEARRKRS